MLDSPRRKPNHLLPASVWLSAATSLAFAVLWLWSFFAEQSLSFSVGGSRYTVRSARGRLALHGPPKEAGGTIGDDARRIVNGLDDAQVKWWVAKSSGFGRSLGPVTRGARMSNLTTTRVIQVLRDGGGRSALLPALDDPRTSMSAHVLLTATTSGDPKMMLTGPNFEVSVYGSNEDTFNGLHLRRDAPTARVVPDQADRKTIIDQWHRTMDVEVAHLPHAAAIVGLVTWPLVRMLLTRRRGSKRLREGRCAVCGYDLRATPGECPECGALPSSQASR